MNLSHLIIGLVAGFVFILLFKPLNRKVYSVFVFEYNNGSRAEIFRGSWMSYNEARAAGQAVISCTEQMTGNCNYTYEIVTDAY